MQIDIDLPVNTENSDDPHGGELVAHIHNNHSLAHEVSKDPLSVSDKLMDVEGHH